jgi:DNA ligase (NAD+)
MEKRSIHKRIGFLVSELQRHQSLYYRETSPEITDREYDALFDELAALEKEYPAMVLPDSPTKRVGSDLDNEFPEVPHPSPMLSLDKVYTLDDLDKWIDKTNIDAQGSLSWVTEEKVDGSTIVLHYEKGTLVRAVTRGDGFFGNDITENIRTIHDIPLRLNNPITSVFRGEIYINKGDFENLNRAMDNIYANPRNFAAGNLRRKKSSEVARIPLHAYIYEGLSDANGMTEHIFVLHRLWELGFRVGDEIGFFTDDASSAAGKYDLLFQKHEKWVCGKQNGIAEFIGRKMEKREPLPYEIDGYVVKVNEYRERDKMGFTSHHPRWAIAYKFEAPQAVSTIRDIEVQVGRTGRVTPVARIEPVRISGSTVSNVTLHNQDYISSLEAAVGDKVAVSKRGDVIPAVEDVLEKNSEGNTLYRIPQKCPFCSTLFIQEGAHHFCPNKLCPARTFGRLLFFVSRGQMDIENLGYETIRRLLELKLISDIPDIYRFDPDRLLGEEGFGEKKVSLIRDGIEKSKNRPFTVVLSSLGLDEIGPRVVELLVEGGYDSIDELIREAREKDPELFTRIDGIGPKIAHRIIDQLTDPFIIDMIEKLKESGLQFTAQKKPGKSQPSSIFEGQVWCVTGSFQLFKPRERAMDEVKRRGGRVSSGVTGNTTHLLVGENPGSKFDKAKKLGTRLVTESEFLELISQ